LCLAGKKGCLIVDSSPVWGRPGGGLKVFTEEFPLRLCGERKKLRQPLSFIE